MSARRAGIVVAALAVALSACGITVDESPRDVDQAQRKDIDPVAPSEAGASTGAGRIYVLAADTQSSPTQLVSVPRDVPDNPTALLEALFAGPNAQERDGQLSTAIPGGTRLRSVRQLSGGVLVVDIAERDAVERLSELRSVRAIAAVAQIVYTASELSSVTSVRLLVDGARQSWPAGDGELRSQPLSVYDFPDLVASAQPAYPPMPSG